MQHRSIFVFDIETVPDTSVVKALTDSKSKSVKKLREELENYHLEITGGKNSFPRQLFHKVTAISFLEADIIKDENGCESYSLTDVRSGGTADSDEEQLVKGFFSHLDPKRKGGLVRLVSFNGRGFDLPVLKYRAMKYGVCAPWLYNSGDKWNNYMQRYSNDWHCDLLEALSDYGASARIKMNEVCAILGLPGKVGMDGSKVSECYDKGEIDKIRDYCETDVLNTYLVYLHYMYHSGKTSRRSISNSIGDLIGYLDMSQNDGKEHFKEFLSEWKKSDESGIFNA